VYDNGKYGLFSYMAPSVLRLSFDFENEITRRDTIRLDGNKMGEYNCPGGGELQRMNNLLE
jgi:hypothetical protein